MGCKTQEDPVSSECGYSFKPVFEEKQPWQLPVSSDSCWPQDSGVSGEMKLIVLE